MTDTPPTNDIATSYAAIISALDSVILNTPSMSNYATTNSVAEAVKAESDRAKASEGTLMSLKGGNVSGDILLTGESDDVSYNLLFKPNANTTREARLQLAGAHDTPQLDLSVVDNSGVAQYWAFDSTTKSIISPRGGHLSEFYSSTTGYGSAIQSFTAKVTNGSYVTFPQSFANDTVQVIMTPYNNGTNIVTLAVSSSGVNKNGFTVNKALTGPVSFGWDTEETEITITAIGSL